MSDLYIEQIKSGNEVKENILALKDELRELKEGSQRAALLIHVKKEQKLFEDLLFNEDPKIRKNTALILASVQEQCFLDALFKAYITDETRYNKAAYLKAIAKLDHTSVDSALSERKQALINTPATKEDVKHVIEEMKELNQILGTDISHSFTGYELVNELVLDTNRNYKNITIDKLAGIPHKEFTAGVMVKTKKLQQVLNVRTYNELCFIPDNIRTCSFDPQKASEQLLEGNIYEYVCSRHDHPELPFRFRIELRCKNPERKAKFEKELAAALEVGSGWKLVNSVSNYEIEFRFVENSSGDLNILVKLLNLKDNRFAYRKETLSQGMKPYLAATVCELVKNHLKEGACILDPFCGTGVLLVERNIVSPAKLIYGIDIYKDAVKKSHINLSSAKLTSKSELINKDFFEFHHSHKFDEIITEFPYVTDSKDRNTINEMYEKFFKKLPSLLESENRIIIYSHNREILKATAIKYKYTILEEFEISKVEGTYLFVIKH